MVFERIESGSEESSEDDLPPIREEEVDSDPQPISLSADYQAGRSRAAYMAVRPPSPDAPAYRAFTEPGSPDLETQHRMLHSQMQSDDWPEPEEQERPELAYEYEYLTPQGTWVSATTHRAMTYARMQVDLDSAPERQRDESHSSFSWIHLGVHPRIEPNNRVAHMAVRSTAPAPGDVPVPQDELPGLETPITRDWVMACLLYTSPSPRDS